MLIFIIIAILLLVSISDVDVSVIIKLLIMITHKDPAPEGPALGLHHLVDDLLDHAGVVVEEAHAARLSSAQLNHAEEVLAC